jgi:site-specific DNA-cytosine methylase
MKMIDVFSGIGAYSIGAAAHEQIAHVETNGYKSHVLDNHFNVPNFGDVKFFARPEREIPYTLSSLDDTDNESELPMFISSCQAKRQPKRFAFGFHNQPDSVPSEIFETEFCSLEDFYSGHFDFPDIITFSIPCKDVSRSNFHRLGIEGLQTGLVVEAARVSEVLSPKYVMVECTEDFVRANMGGGYLIDELAKNDYTHIEWHTISAAALGYPQLRHRVFIVAAHEDSAIAKTGHSAFTDLLEHAGHVQRGNWDWQCFTKDQIDRGIVEQHMLDVEPKKVQWRSLSINALGDGLIPKIPELLFQSILNAENGLTDRSDDLVLGEYSAFDVGEHLSRNGCLMHDRYYSKKRNAVLDLVPTDPRLAGKLFPTLFAKEGNNLASGKSRANKAGGLGGFAGLFRSEYGVTQGGLNKSFASKLMGYPSNWL